MSLLFHPWFPSRPLGDSICLHGPDAGDQGRRARQVQCAPEPSVPPTAAITGRWVSSAAIQVISFTNTVPYMFDTCSTHVPFKYNT